MILSFPKASKIRTSVSVLPFILSKAAEADPIIDNMSSSISNSSSLQGHFVPPVGKFTFHGSSTSTNEANLTITDPSVAVCSILIALDPSGHRMNCIPLSNHLEHPSPASIVSESSFTPSGCLSSRQRINKALLMTSRISLFKGMRESFALASAHSSLDSAVRTPGEGISMSSRSIIS